VIDRNETRSTNGRIGADSATPAERLRTTMAACRVQFTWLGTKKSLTAEQKAQAAEPFDAEGQFLSAGKKLLDTKHNAFRAVTAIRTKITDYWRGLTLPFPEPGVRLIKHDQVEGFDQQMADFKAELEDAVKTLDRCFEELKQAAAQRLGSLFNPEDYPATLVGLFGVSWDYPNIEPPDYLIGVSPELYRQEQERVRARFEDAVQLAEQAFLDEFARLVAHLTERITGTNEDGSPKVFRDSAIDNLCDFFERFRSLNVRSNQQLDELVAQAQRTVRGVAAQDLRDGPSVRQEVATQLARVQTTLDAMLVERPRRRILRNTAVTGEG
jgi:5'-deoxynucleotidase YfbR-like HD superfamily hydrolase